MTTNVTSPALYALGTVTTLVSFVGDHPGAGLDRDHPEAALAWLIDEGRCARRDECNARVKSRSAPTPRLHARAGDSDA